MGRLANEETNRVSVDRTAGFVFPLGKEVVRGYLRSEHLSRWMDSNVCRHSKTLVSQPMPSRANEPFAMSRPKLQSGCGTVNRPHNPYSPYVQTRNPTSTVWGRKRTRCAYCVSLSSTGMEKIQQLGSYVFETEGSRENVRVNSPIT